ncbi:MAG: chemotaxis protein CheB [Myxococcota bacterium]
MRSSKRLVGRPFAIVGVGASAGGLEAFTQLMSALPADSGMAFVLVQHLDPGHVSLLAEALAKVTAMTVKQADDGDVVAPNCVYVAPPKGQLTVEAGVLHLTPRPSQRRKATLPIDTFLRSLADAHGSHAIGVILSGNASDGTDGLRAIKSADGITFAQEPASARFDGMPRSAVDAGVVDYVLPIPDLAVELIRLSHHPYVVDEDAGFDPETRASVIEVLRRVVGVDFGDYKPATFERRLARRMAVRNIDTLPTYLALLEAEPTEATHLYEAILVHVTSFFRDPEAFESLRRLVFPEIMKSHAEGQAIRVWVTGCASGEEVYSLAILLLEFLASESQSCPIQIFGSDISDAVIDKARQGIFAESALQDVDDERRRRFFTRVEGGYRINKSVRDLCVFVRHDLTADPPFSKLDLVTCRNVLIYFDQPLQKRVLPILHYALNPKGFLMLGRTESISGFASLFSPVDRANKVFSRTATASVLRFAPRSEMPPLGTPPMRLPRLEVSQRFGTLSGQLDRLLLNRYSPPGVVINERMEILQFRGETGAFLQPAPGRPQNSLMKMVRPGLGVALRAAVARARIDSDMVRSADVEIEVGGALCDIVVLPVPGSVDDVEPMLLVLFEPSTRSRLNAPSATPANEAVPAATADAVQRSRKLELELAATREYLQSLVDAQDQTNEELNGANEELLSGNEELQSLNEELETA